MPDFKNSSEKSSSQKNSPEKNSPHAGSAHGKALSAVPTNIVTGFLGVGKTSAILNLLKSKPADERWAVLVNEFGEIGVDGSLFAGQYPEEQGVFIKEVPGGCMCCAAGLPMQIALNQLLVRARPDRLLIEPTGLGHPFEVLEVLASEVYKDIIDLQKTVTLVDARKLSDERYTTHETFNQQIAMADVVVGNKVDLYTAGEKQALYAYLENKGLGNNALENSVFKNNALENKEQRELVVEFSEYGKLDPNLLKGSASFVRKRCHHHDHDDHSATDSKREKDLVFEQAIPAQGYLKAVNEGEGFRSMGWRFGGDKEFARDRLFELLSALNVERMKAVFITDEGVFGYNLAENALTEVALDECLESRIEVIARELDDSLESRLMACLKS